MAITSCDQDTFYVHRRHLSHISTNAFAGLLNSTRFSVTVEESTAVLNVVLHTIYAYDVPDTFHKPSLDTIEAAIDALLKYGITPKPYAAHPRPLYRLLLSHAPLQPIDAYALAGKHGFEDAAVAISAHLLAYDLSRITDQLSLRMGPVYLRRLVGLHQDRGKALKDIVLRPPDNHPPTVVCGPTSQAALTRAWALATAELAWWNLSGKLAHLFCLAGLGRRRNSRNFRAAVSTYALRSLFEKAGRDIACEDCRAVLQVQIQKICSLWSEVKVGVFVFCMDADGSRVKPRVLILRRCF